MIVGMDKLRFVGIAAFCLFMAGFWIATVGSFIYLWGMWKFRSWVYEKGPLTKSWVAPGNLPAATPGWSSRSPQGIGSWPSADVFYFREKFLGSMRAHSGIRHV